MRRIFLVGCPRSGTTLVQSLLAAAPGMRAFTESHFFDKCFSAPGIPLAPVRFDEARARATLGQFCAENGIADCRLDDNAWSSPAALAAGFAGLLDRNAADLSASGWIEKTPDHLRRISLLRTAAPDATIVHVLRNPAETIASLCRASREWGRPRGWLAFAAKWGMSAVLSARYAGSPGHVHVFYEDVIGDSRAASRWLFAALELPWDEGVLERYQQAARAVVLPHESWKANNLREIGPRSDDRIEHRGIRKPLLAGLEKLYGSIKVNAEHARQQH